MANPASRLPGTPEDYRAVLRDELKRFRDQIENALEAVYRLGIEHGDTAAITRILKAAQPSASGQAADVSAPSRSARTSTASEDAPGAATHKLIEAVLRTVPSGKASPTEVRMSSLNKTQIKRDAIRNAMRRGRKSGRYISDGKGRYSLGSANG